MQVYIIGCGGNSKIVADICELNNYQIMGFFDDKYTGSESYVYRGYLLIGKVDDITKYSGINIISSIGDCIFRATIYQKFKNNNLNWINCIHPQSYIASTAKMGIGNIICNGAIINSDAKIGDFNLINTYAVVEHDCLLGNFNHLAPKTVLCGNVRIGDCNLLGVGTSVIPGRIIGNNNIIGAMTAVIHHIDNSKKIIGVPGREMNVH